MSGMSQPTPSSVQGTVEPLRLTALSGGGRVGVWGERRHCFVSASCLPLPLQPLHLPPNWHLASAQGDRGQVSRWPAA